MIKYSNAHIETAVPGPNSIALMESRKQYVAKGVGNITPIFVNEGKGALIQDIDGNVFVDFAAGIGVQNVGHCDPAIVSAIQDQTEKLIHPCFHVSLYESYVQLAQKLTEIVETKSSMKAMFANSGAEAVENAIKISRRYTKKTGILSLENSFHGRTFMAMSITSKVKPYKNGFGPFMADTYKIPSANCYRCPYQASYPSCGIACAEKFRTLLKGELSSDYIAVLIAEPVQGEGGFIVPPKEYLSSLQEICKEHDIVFVIDEVQSGFARTGTFFAYEQFDLDPDLITLSKGIAAGMPISAVVGKAEIMDAPSSGEIGGTYGGSPVACEAALKVIEKIQSDDLCASANFLGKYMLQRLQEMKDKYDIVGDVRGLGAMCGIEFVKDQTNKEPYKEVVSKIISYALQRGVIFISAGIFGNVIRFLPPLVMTQEQAQYGMDVLEQAIASIQ